MIPSLPPSTKTPALPSKGPKERSPESSALSLEEISFPIADLETSLTTLYKAVHNFWECIVLGKAPHNEILLGLCDTISGSYKNLGKNDTVLKMVDPHCFGYYQFIVLFLHNFVKYARTLNFIPPSILKDPDKPSRNFDLLDTNIPARFPIIKSMDPDKAITNFVFTALANCWNIEGDSKQIELATRALQFLDGSKSKMLQIALTAGERSSLIAMMNSRPFIEVLQIILRETDVKRISGLIVKAVDNIQYEINYCTLPPNVSGFTSTTLKVFLQMKLISYGTFAPKAVVLAHELVHVLIRLAEGNLLTDTPIIKVSGFLSGVPGEEGKAEEEEKRAQSCKEAGIILEQKLFGSTATVINYRQAKKLETIEEWKELTANEFRNMWIALEYVDPDEEQEREENGLPVYYNLRCVEKTKGKMIKGEFVIGECGGLLQQ
eukprot:TRINITY_DN44639_c0_g1_i1.p1 TRINITY_DN44639_c0_g1~~TRINITY_DN44639_c0_g1_i1.p1  ORF type:complete len:435 (-),score=31.47 TRINITY_DN44639_c0_g1_i1:203-1507(-)